MPNIKALFPTLIYQNVLSGFKELHESYIQKAIHLQQTHGSKKGIQWQCNTYATLYVENLISDPLFRSLIFACGDEVKNFIDYIDPDSVEIVCNEVWVNIAKPNCYQEQHIHPGHHFSVVYYVKVPKDSGKLIFRPQVIEMLPLAISNYNEVTSEAYAITPEEGDVVIFRSHTPHMVTINNSNEDRVSIAMNFTVRSI